MKVIQINSVSNSGSTGRITEGIGELLLKNNYRSVIFYGRLANNSKSRLVKIGSKIFQFVHLLLTRLTDLHGFGSYFDSLILIYKLKKEKPDIIHLHNLHGYYLNFPILFKFLRKSNIPIVWTLHDCWAFTGHCSHYVTVDCKKWQTGCFSCPLTNDYPKSLYDNSKFNYNKKKNYFTSLTNLTIVTPSLWLKEQVEQSFLQSFPLKVINNGINLIQFNPSELKLKTNKLQEQFVVLGVSSVWTANKGLYDFFDLSKRLDNNFKIVLIGLNEKQLSKLPNNIIGVKRTESVQELANYYAMADVFFNPTYEDTFPTTNIESLACGTPVITYNTGGSPEILDSQTGYVVSKGDLNEVVNLLISLREKGVDSRDLCIKRAQNLYDQEICFGNYIKLYKNILNERI